MSAASLAALRHSLPAPLLGIFLKKGYHYLI
jgi:hypothetical protein